jgi:hypothetical protein
MKNTKTILKEKSSMRVSVQKLVHEFFLKELEKKKNMLKVDDNANFA